MTTEKKRVLPRPSVNPELTKPFWEGTKRHELWLQYCQGHGGFFFYPREVCPVCLAPLDKLVWTQVSGKGRVYSYTTVFQPAMNEFADDAPIIHALIQLDEGARMVGMIKGFTKEEVSKDPGLIKVNQRVQADFEDLTDDWTIVNWRLIDEDPTPGSDS